MKVIHSFSEIDSIESNIVCALGTFDGIHLGHEKVIMGAVEEATKKGCKSMVITFDKHPFTVLDPVHTPSLLMSDIDRLLTLSQLGIDYMLILPMSEALLKQEASDFIAQLVNTKRINSIYVGANFTFGYKGLGTALSLQNALASYHIKVHIMSLLKQDKDPHTPISSSSIRNAIQRGEIEKANAMLTKPFGFWGTVIYGDQRGRTLGFPTMNFIIPDGMVQPKDGVYVNRVLLEDTWYNGIGNVGDNPTFKNQTHRLEVHVFDFDDDVYGKKVYIEFLSYLRDERKYNVLAELIKQMNIDQLDAIAWLRDHGYIDKL